MRVKGCSIKIVYIFILSGILLLILNAYGDCLPNHDEHDKMAGPEQNKKDVWVDAEKVTQKEVPYNAVSAEMPFVSDARISEGIKETVVGLKSVGYTTDDIVKTLKNGNKNAAEISIACLNANISGKEVYSALMKNGFSRQAVEAAVPVALRDEGQLFYHVFGTQADTSSVTDKVIIKANPFSSGAVNPENPEEVISRPVITSDQQLKNTVTTLRQSNVDTPQIVKILKDMGASGEKVIKIFAGQEQKMTGGIFNGLGEWNKFQDGRYDSGNESKINTVQGEVVKSMLASGYTTEDIVKGFTEMEKDKNTSNTDSSLRTIIGYITSSGIKLEDVINALKNNGFTQNAIIDIFIGKSASFLEKVKSGMLFNGTKNNIAEKIIDKIVQGESLKPVVQKLQASGYKSEDIAAVLGYLKVSPVQIAETFKNVNLQTVNF